MLTRAETVTAPFGSISLEALIEQAALQSRVDSKYIVTWDVFEALAAQLQESHLVLEIGGNRVFTYDTVYFDTGSLRTYRDHVQRRRKRFKCRARRYVETDHYAFEVKLKGLRGMTVKHALLYDRVSHGTIDARARSFLDDCLTGTYGTGLAHELRPTLRTEYRRMTFALRGGVERLTCDFGLAVTNLTRQRHPGTAAIAPDRVILEHKSDGAASGVHRALRALGARPVTCSKYCVGMALTHPGVQTNDFRRLIRAHFAPGPGIAAPAPVPVAA